MKVYGGIYYNEDGISTSIRGMHLQTALMATANDNVNSFGKVGYQRRVPIVSSFAEYIGHNGISEVIDTKPGRIRMTKRPLDLALIKEGYFQYQTPEGIKQTRDGRFKIDKDGYLLTLDERRVLSNTGEPIKFKVLPDNLDDIKISKDGTIKCLDAKNKKIVDVGQLSVVSSKGDILADVDVRQGYEEDSNVTLQNEFFALVPIRRNFEANRQLLIIQNDQLSKTISELGRMS